MLNQAQIQNIIKAKYPKVKPTDIVIVGIRGAMGSNQIGVFDDRVYLVMDSTIKGTWVYNTDPSSDTTGRAHLKPGIWKYRLGKHHINDPAPKGRPGLVQAQEVTVHRTNQGDDTGWFGINFHNTFDDDTTSSAGCQTFKGHDWRNGDNDGFLDVFCRLAKLVPADGFKHPSGIGPIATYILLTADEANQLAA